MAVDYVEIRIPVEQLKIGMHVVRLDRPWLDTDFVVQGFLIQSAADIEAVREQCDHVFVEGVVEYNPIYDTPVKINASSNSKNSTSHASGSSLKGKAPAGQRSQAPQRQMQRRIKYVNSVSMEQEMETAIGAFHQARTLAKNIMSGLRMGMMLDLNNAKQVVGECVDSVLRNQDALLWLTHIKRWDEYTSEHSMNVCILTAAFAKHLGMDEGEIQRVALCGLLHDVGKTRIPLDILNKDGAFTPEELAIMKMHPSHGRDILMATPNCSHIAVDVAYSHHERMSGNGYPRGLQEHQIPYYAKIVTITDAYDAMTSHRCYSRGRSSKEALDSIYKYRGDQFDEELALEFIQCIGVYPPGSIVEMRNGEVGIVIASNPRSKLRPKVILLLDEHKEPRAERFVDLMKLDLDAAGQRYVIKKELPNGSFGINLQDYLEKGLVLEIATPPAE